MKLYRATKEKYLENYSGKGNSYKNGGRWNSKGFPILYFSLSPSVVLLELANYFGSPRLVPKTYKLGTYQLPDDIYLETLTTDNLSLGWDSFPPYPKETQEKGSLWLESNSSIGLIVPSAAVPEGIENNILINPNHPEIEKLKLIHSTYKLYNERAFKNT